MNNKEEILFFGGIDTDSDARYVANGDYRESYYCRGMSAHGYDGAQVSMIGTTLVNNAGLPAGQNLIIGSCGWVEDRSIIFFLYNSNLDHQIWKYNTEDEAFDLVMQDSVLNFSMQRKIVNPFVVNGVLYWTDGFFGSFLGNNTTEIYGYNPPRRLDIQKAIDGDYSAFTFRLLDAVRWPPRFAPDIQTQTDTNFAYNFIYGRLFQFCYRYIYDDNQRSALSPVSALALYEDGYWMSGIVANNPQQDNAIEIQYNTGPEYVDRIEILYREGNNGIWRLWRSIDKAAEVLPDNTTEIVNFYNDTLGNAVNSGVFQFDTFPITARAQEFLPSSEIAYANIREGYDKVTPDITVSVTPIEIEDENGLAPIVVTFNQVVGGAASIWTFGAVGYYAYQPGDVIVFQIYPFTLGTAFQTHFFTVTTETDYSLLVASTAAFLTAEGYSVTADAPNRRIIIANTRQAFLEALQTGSAPVIRPVHPKTTFKLGSRYIFAIQYEDRANRPGTVFQTEDLTVDIPWITDIDFSGFTNARAPFYIEIKLTIDNPPPTWATHYRVVYKPAGMVFNANQRTVYSIDSIVDNPTRLAVSLENVYTTENVGATLDFTPQPGDRMRFIRKSQDWDVAFNFQAEYLTEYIDLQIYRYGPGEGVNGTDLCVVDYFDWSTIDDVVGLFACKSALVEVYRPYGEDENRPFFVTNTAFSIIDPHTANRRHDGDVAQVLSPPSGAEVFLSDDYRKDGDWYLRVKKMDAGNVSSVPLTNGMWWCESKSYSDYFVSQDYSRGALAPDNPNGNQKHLIGTVIHSNKLLDNTLINGLNTMEAQNRVVVSDENGEICRIIQDGYTLNVLQDNKVSAIYNQKSLVLGGDGNTNVITSTSATFAQVRPREQTYGCIDSSAAIKVDWGIYYYDRLNAKVIYINAGGQEDLTIGKYKCVKLFQDINALLDTAEEYYIYPYHDVVNREIVFQFAYKEEGPSGKFTYIYAVFNYVKGRWTSLMRHQSDWSQNLGDYLVSWVSGQLYKYNQGSYLNFLGQPQTQSLKYVAKGQPTLMKIWRAVALKTNSVWALVANILPNASYTAMQTSIPATSWALREGFYYAPYKRDINTPNFVTTALAEVNGRQMRGYEITNTISQASTSQVIIWSSTVQSQNSIAIV